MVLMSPWSITADSILPVRRVEEDIINPDPVIRMLSHVAPPVGEKGFKELLSVPYAIAGMLLAIVRVEGCWEALKYSVLLKSKL